MGDTPVSLAAEDIFVVFGPSYNEINALTQFSAPKVFGPKHGILDLNIEREVELNGLRFNSQ
jgi:hypothetical protein